MEEEMIILRLWIYFDLYRKIHNFNIIFCNIVYRTSICFFIVNLIFKLYIQMIDISSSL